MLVIKKQTLQSHIQLRVEESKIKHSSLCAQTFSSINQVWKPERPGIKYFMADNNYS